MSNMAHYRLGDQAQLPHLEPHVVYQYRLTPHAQGISYSIRSSGYYPLTYCVPYAISYAPVTAHYPSYHLGRALQMTNILRDLDEDAEMGRLYLPDEALAAAGISSREIP